MSEQLEAQQTFAGLGKHLKPTYSKGMEHVGKTACPGCGVQLEKVEGPVHEYMEGSPACFALFTQLLACEYSDRALLPTHRLTVDTYAVQHPGRDKTRQQIQSVGLHLARLGLQLARPLPPKETNDVMLGLGRHKHTLEFIEPPKRFSATVANPAEFVGTPRHADKVREWAVSTWNDWSDHHDYILRWTTKWL
ncbi:MAG: DUF5946 family protein [Stappiaceae bacterium]